MGEKNNYVICIEAVWPSDLFFIQSITSIYDLIIDMVMASQII